jgi:hypothetical protein
MQLIEKLALELERPRELSPRVINYIGGTYNVDPDAVGEFLERELPKLEDYEIDLILSPLFTPKLSDQAIFADILRAASVPREQWPGLVSRLVERPTRAHLVTPNGAQHAVELRDVTIERYVHRLRLEATIPESLLTLIERCPSETDRPALMALARRAVWENAGPRRILEVYLELVLEQGSYSLDETLDLLNLAEDRKPADLDALIAWIPRWAESLRQQIDTGGGAKPFFHSGVEQMHGGSRDQRKEPDPRLSAKEKELAFLLRLQQLVSASSNR